jgi:hypothetical protein
MKKILITFCLLIFLGSNIYSQSVLKIIKADTETLLRKYIEKTSDGYFLDSYKYNTLVVESAEKQSDGSILLKGKIAVYSYRRTTGEKESGVVSRSIKVTLKKVLDDYEITDMKIRVQKLYGNMEWYWLDLI